MAGARITEAERDQVRDLHAAGLSANAIGREIGRPAQSVSRVAAQLGLSFDRSKTRAAHAARVTDMKAARSRLAGRLLAEAESLLDDLHRPFLARNFAPGGDPDLRFSQHLAMPEPADKAALMRAFSAAMAQHLKLADFDGDSSIDHSKSLLGSLFESLRQMHGDGDGEYCDYAGNDPV